MGSLNTVTLIGRLGKDAELRYTPGGSAVANFNLATSESWKDKDTGEKKEKTEWSRCVVWGKTAETLAQYLLKGREVCVIGKLETRTYEKDGQKHYATEIKADRIVLLGSGKGGERADDDSPTREQSVADGRYQATDSDVPF